MKKFLAIVLAVILTVSASMLPASAVSIDDLPDSEQVSSVMDTGYGFLKTIIKVIHTTIGGLLGRLNKDCPFCGAVHKTDKLLNEPTVPEVPEDADRIKVASDSELLAALESENNAILLTGSVTYDWGNESYDNSLALKLKGKDIKGATGKEFLTFKGYGSANVIKGLSLTNVVVLDKTVGDNEASWEHGYLEFEDLTAASVVFANSPQLNGACVLTDCTFTGYDKDRYALYGAWVNSGDITFTSCTFNGTSAIKVHEAYGSDVSSVAVDGCTFNALFKPGVVIGNVDAATSVTITNSTFNGCAAGSQGMYIYETDTPVDSFSFVMSGNTVK